MSESTFLFCRLCVRYRSKYSAYGSNLLTKEEFRHVHMDLHEIGLSKRSRLLQALLCTLSERAMISSFKEKETALIVKANTTQASIPNVVSLSISYDSLAAKNNIDVT